MAEATAPHRLAVAMAHACEKLITIPPRRTGRARLAPAAMLALLAGNPSVNRLIAALSPADRKLWLQWLEPIDMPLGKVLCEAGEPMTHAYLPTTAIVSLVAVTASGDLAEIAVVGHEGLVGISLFMGGETTPNRAVVQSAGHGYRLTAEAIKSEFSRSHRVVHLLLRYTQALITQMGQIAACNRHHSVEQQLCRWLLMSSDRLLGSELRMTQQLIANMLGVRREGVTEAALRLQDAGVLRYMRGKITIVDRSALESRCCECYQVVKREYARLLPSQVAM